MPPKGGIRSAAYAAFIKAMAKPSRQTPPFGGVVLKVKSNTHT